MSTATAPRTDPTPESEPPAKPLRRVGDLVFYGISAAAGIGILLTLLGVAIFLTVEGVPGI